MCGGRLNASLQLNFPAALGNTDTDLAVGLLPTLTDDIPIGEIVLGDGDLGLLRLTWPQRHVGEALEGLWGCSGRDWEFQVQLRRLI